MDIKKVLNEATKEIEELFEPGDKRFPVSLYAEGDDYIGMPDGKPTEVFTYTKAVSYTHLTLPTKA